MSDSYARGVEAGVSSLVMYFQDENENSILTDFSTKQLEEFVEWATRDALNDRKIWDNQKESK